MKPVQKIICVKLRAIGDTVIWTAALSSLRKAFPDAKIHTLTYQSNSAILKNHPAIDQAHYLKSPSRLELIKTLWQLRRENFDWFLGFHATTSLLRWAWLTKSRQFALHHHSQTSTPANSVPIPHAGVLEDAISRDFRVVQAIAPESQISPTQIALSHDEALAAEARVQDEIARSGGNPRLPRYVFLPGAGHHLRRYPKELWLPMAEQILMNKEFQPIVLADQALSQELNLKSECQKRSLPLIDQGNLRDFVANVSRGQKALANDSGPGHIAVALGLHTHFVFGPGCVGDWHPYDANLHPVHRIQVDCRLEGPRERERFQFCVRTDCAHHKCMRDNRFDLV